MNSDYLYDARKISDSAAFKLTYVPEVAQKYAEYVLNGESPSNAIELATIDTTNGYELYAHYDEWIKKAKIKTYALISHADENVKSAAFIVMFGMPNFAAMPNINIINAYIEEAFEYFK